MDARTTVEDGRPLVIVVSPMARVSRGYMLESLAKEYRLWVFAEEGESWDRGLAIGHTVTDTLDAEAMIEAARDIPAVGVLCWNETRILPASRLAEARGLPTLPSAVVRTCRDKLATRQALQRQGTSAVRAAAARDVAEALDIASRIGYPVVLKPRALAGSIGTTLVRGADHLRAVFDSVATRAMPAVTERFASPVVVEEYLDGPEISVDSLCWDGAVLPSFIARKRLGFFPHFEEVGHTVDSADPLLHDPGLLRALTETHEAVGVTRGWTHTEWRLTSRGPRLVEINARSGGDLIPYLGQLVTGVDTALATASLALGTKPTVRGEPGGAASVRFLYPRRDTVFGSIRVDTDALPAALEQLTVLASPGQLLLPPPATHVTCRYARLVAVASTPRECEAALDAAERAVTLVPAETAHARG